MLRLTNRTEPSPISAWQPSPSSEYISSVWPNGWFGAWMITCGWSWTSGPLWAPTRSPPLFGSEGQPGLGVTQEKGTTPTQVLSESFDDRSPTKTVFDSPSVTPAALVREFR